MHPQREKVYLGEVVCDELQLLRAQAEALRGDSGHRWRRLSILLPMHRHPVQALVNPGCVQVLWTHSSAWSASCSVDEDPVLVRLFRGDAICTAVVGIVLLPMHHHPVEALVTPGCVQVLQTRDNGWSASCNVDDDPLLVKPPKAEP